MDTTILANRGVEALAAGIFTFVVGASIYSAWKASRPSHQDKLIAALEALIKTLGRTDEATNRAILKAQAVLTEAKKLKR